MFSRTYYLSVLVVTVGASAQFYSYGVVNNEQTLVISWINRTYTERSRWHLSVGKLNMFWSFVVSAIPVGAIVGKLFKNQYFNRLIFKARY